MAAKDRFDVQFARDYQPPSLGDWLETENRLPGPLEPYFLRANTGPRWMLGGVMSRPFITAGQCSGKFAITSLESSNAYGPSSPLGRWLTFASVDHCLCVQEGLLRVKVRGEDGGSNKWEAAREGQTVVLGRGQTFALDFGSRYVRVISFASGRGLEALIQDTGEAYTGMVLPDEALPWEADALRRTGDELGVTVGGDSAAGE